MAPLAKLILIVQAECSENTHHWSIRQDDDSDRFGFPNNGDAWTLNQTERIHELWEDQVLQQSSIQCDVYLEGFPSSYHSRSNDDDSNTDEMQALRQQNVMALYRQTFYPCSIAQNLMSFNMTGGNPTPQEEVDPEIRVSFTNCHFLVDREAVLGGETFDFSSRNGSSTLLYLPLFPSPDPYSFSCPADATSMVLVKEVPLLLDTSHAKRSFSQFFYEHLVTEPLDSITSVNITSKSGANTATIPTNELEEVSEPIHEPIAVSTFRGPDVVAASKVDIIALQNKIHRIMAATIALSTTTTVPNASQVHSMQTTKDVVDPLQRQSILLQQNERRQMIEQMLKQEMHQIHLILLTLCAATLGILLFLGYKLQRHSTEMRKHVVLVERDSGSSSRQQVSTPMVHEPPSAILNTTSQHVSPLSMDPNSFQMEPPLSPSAHPVTDGQSSAASPCTKFWTNRKERRRQSDLIQSGMNGRRRSPIRPTTDAALMISPEPTRLSDIQIYPRVVSPEPFRNECVSAKQHALGLFKKAQATPVKRENRTTATTDPLKPCSPPNIVVQHSSSFLEEYW